MSEINDATNNFGPKIDHNHQKFGLQQNWKLTLGTFSWKLTHFAVAMLINDLN